MKTSEEHFQFLLEKTAAMYNSEKEVSGIFEALSVNAPEAHIKQGIIREAEENRRQCERLEGLLSVLQRNPHKNCLTHDSWENFVDQFSATLTRIALKHAEFGYQTAIFVALALGQVNMASLLKGSLSCSTVISVRKAEALESPVLC